MTPPKAKRLAEKLKGKKVNKWIIGNYINNGKSAFVCKCKFKNKIYAIKIYDKELIELYGKKDIMMRINRQLEFKDKTHKNLVKVYDGGYCSKTDNYYLVMEYLNEENLAQALQKIPNDRIPSIITQIADAAKFLENHRTYHRDIKPENISISNNFKKIKLLDLGVIKPISSIQEPGSYEKKFLGTLQYSPKEFFLDDVDDTNMGWRAVTFYQIGAVIFDLIEKIPLFDKYKTHWGQLSNAVLSKEPEFINPSVPIDLLHLVQKCLNKDKEIRLRTVKWNDFSFVKTENGDIKNIKKRISERMQMGIKKVDDLEIVNKAKFFMEIEKAFETSLSKVGKVNESFPPYDLSSYNLGNIICKIINFNSAPQFALKFQFMILIKFFILDFDKKIVNINYQVMAFKNETFGKMPFCFTDISNDIFTDEKFFNIFEKIFYESFDKAQSLNHIDGDFIVLN